MVKCIACGKEEKEEAFDAENLATWKRSHHVSDCAICLECAPAKRTYFGGTDSQLLVLCSGCKQMLKKSDFDKAAMWPKIEAGNIAFAKCIECMAGADFRSSRPWLKKESFLCHGLLCKGKSAQPISHFSRHTQMSRNLKAWKCENCQKPACKKCGKRPVKPLTYSWKDPYECLECLYPPCSGCGTRRPSKRLCADHIHKAWRCKDCRAAADA